MKNPVLYRCDLCRTLYSDYQEAIDCAHDEQCLMGARRTDSPRAYEQRLTVDDLSILWALGVQP